MDMVSEAHIWLVYADAMCNACEYSSLCSSKNTHADVRDMFWAFPWTRNRKIEEKKKNALCTTVRAQWQCWASATLLFGYRSVISAAIPSRNASSLIFQYLLSACLPKYQHSFDCNAHLRFFVWYILSVFRRAFNVLLCWLLCSRCPRSHEYMQYLFLEKVAKMVPWH